MFRLWSALAMAARSLAAQDSLTLEAAIRETIEHHPLIAAADGRIGTAQGLLEQAALRPNPRLTIQLENLRAWQLPYRPAADNDYFLYLNQVLETAGKREPRGELATANKQIASTARDLLVQQTIARVRQAYWTALGAGVLLKVYDETLKNFAETVTYHETRVREGNMAEADLIRIRLEQERIRLAAASVTLSAQRALIALQREMGRTAIEPKLSLPAEFPSLAAVPSEDPEFALNQRAEIRLARQGVETAAANEKLQIALARPNFEIAGGYKRTNGYDGLLAYLNVDLPWRNRNQGNIAAAGAEIRVARSNIAAAEAQVRAEVRASYADHRLRQDQLNGTIAALSAHARETARIAQAAYREGAADLLRLLDAERTRLETDLVRVQAMTELKLSEAAILSAMGVNP